MSFKEKGKIIGHVNIDGTLVPKYRGDTEITLTNTKTGKEYNSDKEAEDDVANPATDTVKKDIRRDVKITVPKLVMGSATLKE
mgnify:CR=1 FL=1|jgi:hypothetical protein|tara:strand:+ start:1531 stop:1779 length:249 start_codon:yes stop_codon:yes gene_type:complete